MLIDIFKVTPFVGVWIETVTTSLVTTRSTVTPFVGVWIETNAGPIARPERAVTPFVGVWIETPCSFEISAATCRHTLRGCVD